ncbi:S1 family peptidase [Luteimonas suaedae]|uniref:S1 family peptidase n=1 Tax=Luteimonas suaedae TaxID=2605430 RepID=UPI0011F06F5F|nr:S1 family peptidase [Luteimonas suaedae]
MNKFIMKARLVCTPIALAAAMLAGSAFAAEIDPALKSALQRDLGLSGTQLAEYLKAERVAAQHEAAIQRQLGRHFAGSWIERKADGSHGFVVGTTLSTVKAPAGVEVRHQRHSLASLNNAKGRLDQILAQGAKVPRGVYGWYVDLPTNSVVVSIGHGGEEAAIDFVAVSGLDVETVRFETVDEQPRLHMDVLGGYGILRAPGDGYLYACSVGFSVTQSGSPGFATAGHCGDTGEVVYHEPSQWTLGVRLGSYAASNFPSPGQTGPDYAWVRLDSGHTPRPVVEGYTSSDVTVRGNTEAAVGAAVCRSGRTTQWRCGTIEAKNQTVNYSSGETVLNLTRTTACSESGDSGGSFITGVGQAQGVLSGGSGGCRGAIRRSRSFFQPLNPILQTYNLTLLTAQ